MTPAELQVCAWTPCRAYASRMRNIHDTAPQLGDMPAEEFRRHAHAAVDWMADYLADPERWPVLPSVVPGALRGALPTEAPVTGERMEDVLADFQRLIVPATTHWNHPDFFAYFATSGSAAGILGEALASTLNVNAMLWRSGPAATELEQQTLDWLRQLTGLPSGFEGTITDTASSSTLYALAAAREFADDLRIREEGLPGRADVPRMRVYCSEEAHSSVDKAVLTLGLGLAGTRRVESDECYALKPAALAAAIAEDRAEGVRPLAVVATVGTTSTTAVDPVPEIAAICERENLWLHIDAAYGGAAALLPEMRWIMDGCEQAHSLVINPHKWFFVPMDCSVLYTRRPDMLRRTFSVVPEYLTTSVGDDVVNLMDYGVSLGRRFRSLKLWFVLRYFGSEGIARRIREHIRLAQEFAAWVDADPEFERVAPAKFSVVVFRHTPAGMTATQTDAHNMRLLERVNATGEIFVSHTRAKNRQALRLAVGNIRTTGVHVRQAWDLIRQTAADIRALQ
jgi:aromatic-L-amino-acid decarboxylase